MGRRIRKLLVGMSLLLVVASVALWIGSYWHRPEKAVFKRPGMDWIVAVRDGRLVVARQSVSVPALWTGDSSLLGVMAVSDGRYTRGRVSFPLRTMQTNIAGFGHEVVRPVMWIDRQVGGPVAAMGVFEFWVVPLWLVVVVLAGVLLVSQWGRWRRARRAAGGLCPVCGYDLRASPWRCPECGHASWAFGV